MKIARIRGIDVRIHWTFWLLILFYLFVVSRSAGLADGLLAVAFILGVFLCVLLHEFGHAAAAAWYGIPTRDITLLPIGGVARLERLPEKPIQELVVAVAGPAVNVLIAALLLIPVGLQFMSDWATLEFGASSSILSQLMIVNIGLVVFNMLPAFPMDGGRVLRSLLAIRFGHLRATQIAARIGRWMSVAFGLWAILSGNLMLLVLAVFVFLAGTAELAQAMMRNAQETYDSSFDRPPQSRDGENGDIIDAIEFKRITR